MKIHYAAILVCSLSAQAQNPGIVYKYIDSSASPKNDFYSFCNGKWQSTFQLPASDARYGSFNEINENNLKKIKLIYESVAKDNATQANSNRRKLHDFYVTAMDTMKADGLGIKPLAGQMAKIDKVQNLNQFLKLKNEFEFDGINLLFGGGAGPDLKNSKRNIYNLGQAGLGLGDRDYYYSEKFEKIRGKYIEYLQSLFELSGTKADQAKANAELVFSFEKKLADKALTRVQQRDLEKQYNPYSRAMLAEACKNVNWAEYFAEKKIEQPDTVIVGMTEFMSAMNALIGTTSVNELKVYAKAHLLMEAAPFLSRKFVEAHFAFRGKVLSGAQQMKPQWQRVHNAINGSMGEIISQEFVKLYFTPEAKTKVNSLIDNLIASYRERIATRDWMSAETKQQANRKLDLLIRKVGYPDKWKDYTLLQVGTDSYWANICRANRFLIEDNLSELKKPVDRYKWQMTPVTVNAYYDPTTNEITFPAAILQPPFFDPSADDAANYGTMGAIIGHELTHGFDDMGSQFDAEGNMKNWWTEQDLTNFKSRTQKIVAQFDSYVAIDTLHVNGSMTQGENIADLGGLTMAYYAYKKSLAGKPSPVMGGLTGEQRLFMAWTQGWKQKVRDEELKRLLTVDFHAPAYFRSFAPLSNMKEFYEAFGIQPGDKMFVNDQQRVEIW